MKRILVPFDGSDSARRAFEHAAQLAAPTHNAWLHLLNVQLPLCQPWPTPSFNPEPFDSELQRQGLAVLAEAEARAAAMNIPCELEVRIGNPDDEILAAAADNGCHEIVLAAASTEERAHLVRARARVPVTLVH